jgi:hypothetical protein
MSLMQSAHSSVHSFITATTCHTLLNLHVLVVQVEELQLQDVELLEVETPVEVQLSYIGRYKSKK